jgi:crotonobetainyl-CoA:carnitine CoA-transferase CaiB-like acyl-CoA transferase
MTQPLAGIKILEFANFIAGPFCGMLLGDMGADVIKIEPPDTGDMSTSNAPRRARRLCVSSRMQMWCWRISAPA